MAKSLPTTLDIDTISTKAAQLDALLNSIHGGGFSAFMDLQDDLKDSLLQLAANLVSDIRIAISGEVSRG